MTPVESSTFLRSPRSVRVCPCSSVSVRVFAQSAPSPCHIGTRSASFRVIRVIRGFNPGVNHADL